VCIVKAHIIRHIKRQRNENPVLVLYVLKILIDFVLTFDVLV
jgi:hypothetical protein